MRREWQIDVDRPTRTIFVDGNPGTGKTTLVRALGVYLDKLERVFGDLRIALYDGGVATQAVGGGGSFSIRASDVYVFLDASPETSRQRISGCGSSLDEELTLEVLGEHRHRLRNIAADMERELGLSAGVLDHVVLIDAEEPPRRVLLQVVRHLRKLAVLPSLASTLKTVAAESYRLSLERKLETERRERDANASALAHAVSRAEHVTIEFNAARRVLSDSMSSMAKARALCEEESEVAHVLGVALATARANDVGAISEAARDVSTEEMAAVAQAIRVTLPEHHEVFQRLLAELLWRRARDLFVPFQMDETQPPPGWEWSKDKRGWMRKTTFRDSEEILGSEHISMVHAVESHPPARAWEIYKAEQHLPPSQTRVR